MTKNDTDKRGFIDRIKYDGPVNTSGKQQPWLVYKYPYDNIVLGAQLIVNQSQEVVLFKDGMILDVFGPGRYTLNSANIPLLQNLVNKPFGNKTPFTVEVYFVNKIARLDILWGTPNPIIVKDPECNIIVNIRGYGQMGIRVADSRNFITQIVGTLTGNSVSNYETIENYFRGLIITMVNETIANMITNKRVSIFTITASLGLLSEKIEDKIKSEFSRFGIEVLNFFIESINVPDEDLVKLKSIMSTRAEFDILGDDRYTRKRSFDILEKAAENEGIGLAGTGIGVGMGVGAGIAAGNIFYDLSKQMNIHQNTKTKNINFQCPKCGSKNEDTARFCSNCGEKLIYSTIECRNCKFENSANAKFCALCGAILKNICPQCGYENQIDARFCSQCGKKLEV